ASETSARARRCFNVVVALQRRRQGEKCADRLRGIGFNVAVALQRRRRMSLVGSPILFGCASMWPSLCSDGGTPGEAKLAYERLLQCGRRSAATEAGEHHSLARCVARGFNVAVALQRRRPAAGGDF